MAAPTLASVFERLTSSDKVKSQDALVGRITSAILPVITRG